MTAFDPAKRRAGVLVPVFALRAEGDLGIGDTAGVRQMIDWCAHHHFSLLQLLPINETGDDNSPYNAISSIALDPTTIAVSPEEIPELTATAFKKVAAEAEALRQGPVQYRKVKPLKLRLLRDAFGHFLSQHDAHNTVRAREFREFLAHNADWIGDYTLFRALMQIHGGLAVWESWPAEHRAPATARAWILSRPPAERRELEESMLFFAYVQWIARAQWQRLKAHAQKKGVALMGDIPYGIGRCSADVWACRPIFDLRWSCGAPPETFFKPDLFTERWGQNWGIPLYRWDRMAEDGHAWWRARIRSIREVFHFFRIDHVLGFYRIYGFPWKPEQNGDYVNLSLDEARAKAGALPRFWPNDDSNPHNEYLNCQHGEGLLRMVAEAAGDTGVVAEDLGMVPNYVRPSLARLGIPGFKIPMFERHPDGAYKDSGQYPPLSIVTWATHDHEPFAAIWNRWQTDKDGPKEMAAFLKWIGWDPAHPPKDPSEDLHLAMCRKVLECPSRLAVFMITDLFAHAQRFNVPGPMSDSNWTERLALKVADFDSDPAIHGRVKKIARLVKETGRQ